MASQPFIEKKSIIKNVTGSSNEDIEQEDIRNVLIKIVDLGENTPQHC